MIQCMDIRFDLLKDIALLKNKHLRASVEFINSFSLKFECQIDKNYIEPYNIILAASDIYYRENYHSDVIHYILKNKNETLKYFIKYINSLSDNININFNNFRNTEIIREENKIDLLIKDLYSNHCIIMENKINNAGDMARQLPRYYNSVVKQGLTVDGILYFSLDGQKRPDKSSWTNKDIELELDEKIVFGAASNDTKYDFINNFLLHCKDDSMSEQENSFYCQYIDLLKHLRRNHMDYEIMEKFYCEMMNAEQYSSALSIRNMLNDLMVFRRDRVHNYFVNNHNPFERIFKWSTNDTVFEFIRDIAPKENIKIDVFCEQNHTKVQFWIQNPKTKSDLIEAILVKIGEEKYFQKDEKNCFSRIFEFPREDEIMYKYLTKIFSLLDKNKEEIIVK